MIDRKTLIEALKCDLKVLGEKCRDDCPYLLREEVVEGFPVPPDTVIDGKKYWDSCDTDRMTLDCIEMLEGMIDTEDGNV